MRVGVFLPNWIGDAVMATPTLRALARRWGPGAELVGVMRPVMADLFAGTPWLSQNLLYDPRSKNPELRTWSLVKRLRAAKLDQIVLLTNTFRTGLLAWLSGARERIGYACYGRGPLLTRGLEYPQHSQAKCRVTAFPTVDFYLQLAYAAGCSPESPRLELATTTADEAEAHRVWRKLGLGSQVVTFNSSGAFGGAKLWPVEHFAALARQVVSQTDHDVLVICGPAEQKTAAEIVRQAANPRVKSLAEEKLSLGLSKACVRRSQLLVTTDSGPRHFAVAFGVPIVGLFGATPPIWGRNPTAKETALENPLDCSGCHRRECPLGHHRCMRDLAVDRVAQAVAAYLTPATRRVAA
jgi:heptosyltransferase II